MVKKKVDDSTETAMYVKVLEEEVPAVVVPLVASATSMTYTSNVKPAKSALVELPVPAVASDSVTISKADASELKEVLETAYGKSNNVPWRLKLKRLVSILG